MKALGFLETFAKDIAFGWRVLRKSPGYTLIGVLSLALGLGANAAIFSVVRAVLLRQLPYPAPDQLMLVAPSSEQSAVTIPEFEFWRANTPVFAASAGYRGVSEKTLATGSRRRNVVDEDVTD